MVVYFIKLLEVFITQNDRCSALAYLFIFHFVSGDKMSYLFGEKASQSSSEFERVTLKTQMMSVQGRIIKQ